jgi:mannose-6-phosphate isomerase-like protein (cupin superfamily)
MTPLVLNKNELPGDGDFYELAGYHYENLPVSLILVNLPPGGGPKLHVHPYQEIFIIEEGSATFTVGSTVFEAQAGQIVIGPAEVPHKFINTGEGQLRQIDIHCGPQFSTQWLEE